jgi:aldose sugar dehydrogenase
MHIAHSIQAATLALFCLCTPFLFLTRSAGEQDPLSLQPRSSSEERLQPQDVQLDTIAAGVEHPWGFVFLPDGRFLVTERNSGVLSLGTEEGVMHPVAGVPEIFRPEGPTGRSQAGLFDVALHPDFQENRWIYLSFSKPTPRGAALAVVRGRLGEGEEARLEGVEEIFVMNEEDQDSSGLHFGGSLAFHPATGHLYLTVGERRNISRSQDPADQAGAVLRMTEVGEPVADNPFANSGDGDAYIWSYGHRNPQGAAVAPESGELWIVDHGPLGGDGVYRTQRGANFGWPLYTGGVDYSGAPIGYDEPPQEVTPPTFLFEEQVAPSGLIFYQGEAFPGWAGDLFTGGLTTRAIHHLRREADGTLAEQQRLLVDLDRRIRSLAVHPLDGSVWFTTEHADGEVMRLRPAGR